MDTSYEGEKAVLSSPDLYSEEWSCVRLIYQIATTSDPSPDPARLNLYLRQEGESFDRLLWSAKEPSDSWLIASLDLTNSTKKYKVSPVKEDATGFLVQPSAYAGLHKLLFLIYADFEPCSWLSCLRLAAQVS